MKDKIKTIIYNVAAGRMENAKLNENTNLIDEFSFDSIMLIQMIANIEKEFDIEFDSDELEIEKIGVFGSLVQLAEETVSKSINKGN